MKVTWTRTDTWRQTQAMASGETCQQEASQGIPAEWITSLPEGLRSLVIVDGKVETDLQAVVSKKNVPASCIWNTVGAACLKLDADAIASSEELGAMLRGAILRAQASEAERNAGQDQLATQYRDALTTHWQRDDILAKTLYKYPSVPLTPFNLNDNRARQVHAEICGGERATFVRAERTRLEAAYNRQLAARTRVTEQNNQAVEDALVAQLADAVKRLGTESQRERWDAGVMARAEAIALIQAQAEQPLRDAGLDVQAVEWFTAKPRSDSQLDCLTDDEWAIARQITEAIMPKGAEVEYHVENGHGRCYDDDDHDEIPCRRVAYAKITAVVGVVDISMAAILSDTTHDE